MSRIKKNRVIPQSVSERLLYLPHTGQLFWKDGPRKGKEAGWLDTHGYLLTRVEGQLLRNHHIVWFINTGHWPDSELDHIDRVRSNNRFENLRLSDRKGQGANQTLQTRRIGKWKGVHKTSSGKYGVKIKVNGVQITGLGQSYVDPREAALIYNYAAEAYFGPFANYNLVFEDITGE